MKRKNNKLFRSALIGGFGAMMLGAIVVGVDSLNEVTAKAETPNYFVEGTSVRIADDEQNGIRFAVCYEKDAYSNVTESGTLVIPKDVLGTSALEKGNEDARDIDTIDSWNAYTYEETACMRSVAYLYNIPAASYSRTLVVRGYLKTEGASEYTYTAPEEVSFNEVANAALAANDYKNDTQKGMLEDYSYKAPDGSFIDFSSAEQVSASTKTGAPVSFVESYKGVDGVAKVEFAKGGGKDYYMVQNTAWKPEFWKNYYSDYTHITVTAWVENVDYHNDIRLDGVASDGSQTKLYLKWNSNNRTFVQNGWNSVSFTLDASNALNQEWMNNWWDNFSYSARLWGSVSSAYQNNGSPSSHIYFASVMATNTLTVAPTSTETLLLGQEHIVEDDSAAVFAAVGATDVSLEILSDNGKVTVTDGKFTPTVAGAYMLTYTATGADGKTYRASYNLTASASLNVTPTSTKVVPMAKEYTVSDDSATVFGALGLTPTMKVVYAEGNTVTMTDGKFTPAEAGSYTVSYTAEKNGTEYTASYVVTVKRGDLVQDFDDKTFLPQYNGTWMDEYEGEKTVMKFAAGTHTDGTGDVKKSLNFKNQGNFAIFDKSNYEGKTKLVVKLWVEKANPLIYANLIVRNPDTGAEIGTQEISAKSNEGKEWIEVEFDFSKYLTDFETWDSHFSFQCGAWYFQADRTEENLASGTWVNIYISEVYVK